MSKAALCALLFFFIGGDALASSLSSRAAASGSSVSTRKKAGKKSSSSAKKRTSAKKGTKRKKAVAPPVPVLDDPAYPLTAEGRRLAVTLASLWTQDAGRLVSVVTEAWSEDPEGAPLTLMLAIAHAETNGRILVVSSAGAAGLAQATPIAYLRQGGQGKIFITDDYATGAWAYFMKKPLNDADSIASALIRERSEAGWGRARSLLDAAVAYREEGINELRLLSVWARPGFEQRIDSANAENARVLAELDRLIAERAAKEELIRFREMARDRYRALRELQRQAWSRYDRDLSKSRDTLLREHSKANLYEAGEILGARLDARFSPREMARFLGEHIEFNLEQARMLAATEVQVERLTAGLYNGGSQNVKRMLAGLITRLPETENYMRKVPATRRKLDAVLAQAAATTAEAHPRTSDNLPSVSR